ncbi:Cullin repeat-containing protein, partial [Martensiomyces pterosporus]
MGQDAVVPDANTPAFFGYLEEYMDRLFVDHTTRITIDEYMDISSKISEAILANTAILPGSSTTEAASYFEEELFYWLVDYLTDYLEGFLAKADEASGESLLRMYVDEWSYYAGILKVVDRAFRPLNEGWILRAKPTRNVYPIEVTMVQMWYSRLFARIHTRLSDAVIALVDKERSGGVVDSMLIERLYTSFVNLNPEGIPDIHAPYRNNLGAYINYYEQPYIFSAIKRL